MFETEETEGQTQSEESPSTPLETVPSEEEAGDDDPGTPDEESGDDSDE